MRSTRVKWVIALAVVLSGLWLMGVFYVMTYKPEVYNNPGIVTTAPIPSSTPSMSPARTFSPMRSHSAYRTAYTPTVRRTHLPSIPMQSTGGLYLTSSAQPHSVGGGGNAGIYTTTGGSSSSRGIQYSSSMAMPQTNFVAMASSRQMAEPEAQHAPMMARLAGRNAPGPPNPPQPLDPEHQLVEQPVGDAVWPLLLLALAYMLVRSYKRIKE